MCKNFPPMASRHAQVKMLLSEECNASKKTQQWSLRLNNKDTQATAILSVFFCCFLFSMLFLCCHGLKPSASVHRAQHLYGTKGLAVKNCVCYGLLQSASCRSRLASLSLKQAAWRHACSFPVVTRGREAAISKRFARGLKKKQRNLKTHQTQVIS